MTTEFDPETNTLTVYLTAKNPQQMIPVVKILAIQRLFELGLSHAEIGLVVGLDKRKVKRFLRKFPTPAHLP